MSAAVPVFGDPEYVGAKRCKDCHWEKYDTWKNTLHSKFIQEVNKKTVVGDFARNNKLVTKVTDKSPKFTGEDVTSIMFKKGGKYYVNTIGPDWEYHDYEIINVIGIGKRQNYLTKFPNGEMHVLPVEWNIKTEMWIDRSSLDSHYPGNGEFWSNPKSIWQFKCGGCHVTGLNVNYDEVKDTYDTTWVDLGIGCEACHGPGSNHVKAASEHFDYEKDTIINPAKLPWRLRTMVCGQCHNWGSSSAVISASKEGIPKHYGYPFGFRPGEALYLFYDEAEDAGTKHHQQYNEWNESEHSKVGVMCTNCHGVHEDEDVKVAMTKLAADSLCMDCHKTLKRRAAHRIHTFGSCVACHMPRTLRHEHSHTFAFISPELSLKAGGVDKQPNSCSGCHHHKDTPLENLVGFLDAAKKEDMPKPFTVHRQYKTKEVAKSE
jgi:predicted CXXCH cytochrome family protein